MLPHNTEIIDYCDVTSPHVQLVQIMQQSPLCSKHNHVQLLNNGQTDSEIDATVSEWAGA